MNIKFILCLLLTFLVFSIVTNIREGIETDAIGDTDSDSDTVSDMYSDSDLDSDTYSEYNSDNICGDVKLQLLSNRVDENSKTLRDQQKQIDDIKNTAKDVSNTFGDIKDQTNDISNVASNMDGIGNLE